MFNNQLSTKDLYSTNPSQFLQRSVFRNDHQDDSAFNSSQTTSQNNSQLMNSQMDNSQSSSFDMFSQMMMSQQQGSASQQIEVNNNNNPQRFYMKYMSKAPLFSKDSEKNPLPRKKSYQEQMESNKQRAKERDDRDLISTFISLVKDCTEEVKSAATDIREKVDRNITESAGEFGNLIRKINEDLRSYHHTLLDAVKEKEDQTAMVEKMKRTIAARDAKIEVLEMQLDSAKQQKDEQVVQSLLEVYTEQQKMNREQIDKMKEEQQEFCKMQMKCLHENQERDILRGDKLGCSILKVPAAGGDGGDMCVLSHAGENKILPPPQGQRIASGLYATDPFDVRINYGQINPGQIPYAPMGDTVSNPHPHSWQGLPQLHLSGYPVQPAVSRYQQMNASGQNPALQPVQGYPGGATSLISDSRVQLPSAPFRWQAQAQAQAQPDVHPRESSHMQEVPVSNYCQQKQLTISVQGNIPQDGGPSAFQHPTTMAPHHPMTSPPTVPSRWSSRKLKPSPVAAVAPQIVPLDVDQTPGICADEGSTEVPRVGVKRKRAKKQHQVAVVTKRQSARVKAKRTAAQTNSIPTEGKDVELSSDIIDPPKQSETREASRADRGAQHWPADEKLDKKNNDISKSQECRLNSEKVMKQDEYSQIGKRTTQRRQSNQRRQAYKVTNMLEKSQVQISQDEIFTQKRNLTYSKNHRGSTKISYPNTSGNILKPQYRTFSESSSEDYYIREEADEGQFDGDDDEIVDSEDTNDGALVTRKDAKQQPKSNDILHAEDIHGAKKSQHVSQLNTLPCYSDQEESSEEVIFSLKLPETLSHRQGCHQISSTSQKQSGNEQVVPGRNYFDIVSSPDYQERDGRDNAYSSNGKSHKKMSRQIETKRRLSHYVRSSSSSAAFIEITNSLKLQQQKPRRNTSYR